MLRMLIEFATNLICLVSCLWVGPGCYIITLAALSGQLIGRSTTLFCAPDDSLGAL